MYDLSKEFKIFYKNHVVLSGDKQQELRDKKDINIKRLESGLEEYNEENNTNYAIAEKRVQGSMAMHTVVQNDENDYDIDVAIIFDKSNLNGLTPLQARRMVRDALAKKCGQLNADPECKTNCVRVQYATGYHVDFAVYRRFKEENSSEYLYEHAGGSNWTARNPAAITKWFQDEVHEKGTELRQVVRLSKMFCKSRSTWVNMPGGLIQSVVCDEKFADDYERINDCYDVDIACKVEANGIRNQSLQRFLIQYPQFQNLVPHGLKLYFKASTNVPNPDAIWWKVRNRGRHAEARNQIRGQIEKKYWTEKTEDSEFGGEHYVECYVIKNNECVAIKRLNVPIGEKSI